MGRKGPHTSHDTRTKKPMYVDNSKIIKVNEVVNKIHVNRVVKANICSGVLVNHTKNSWLKFIFFWA